MLSVHWVVGFFPTVSKTAELSKSTRSCLRKLRKIRYSFRQKQNKKA